MNSTDALNYEARRLEELEKYHILDSLSEQEYDNITHLASVICDVPISVIAFVHKDRQWFKSHPGLGLNQTSLEYSFCAYTIQSSSDIMIIEDSREDERFKNNPYVLGEPNIVFYAGVPLVTSEGYKLGTVCIIDNKKKVLTPDQIRSLKILSAHVMKLLELRKSNLDLDILRNELESRNSDLKKFANVVSDDIKSPLSNIVLTNNLLTETLGRKIDKKLEDLLAISSSSATKIKLLVDGIVSYYKNDGCDAQHEIINLPVFFDGLKDAFLSHKDYNINYSLESDYIYFNKPQLEQIFLNMISNSIRYNDKDTAQITISFAETPPFYRFSVTDNGIGISEKNKNKIFDLFETAVDKDKFGVRGSGIGLPTIKKLIEKYNGSISIDSEQGKRTTFEFTLKMPRSKNIPEHKKAPQKVAY